MQTAAQGAPALKQCLRRHTLSSAREEEDDARIITGQQHVLMALVMDDDEDTEAALRTDDGLPFNFGLGDNAFRGAGTLSSSELIMLGSLAVRVPATSFELLLV